MQDHYDWLIKFLSDPEKRTGRTIAGIVPDMFEKYFIIEWNYGIIKSFPFDEYPEDSSDIKDLNKQVAIKKAFGLFLNNRTDHLYEPITIKELADRYNIPYTISTVNDIPYTPGISTLSHKTRENLNALVRSLANIELLNLYIDDLYRFPVSDFTSDKSPIYASEYVPFLMDDIGGDSCSYLFPDSRDWCFITVEDFHCVILGVNSKDVQKVFSINSLEHFEVDKTYELFSQKIAQ